MCLCYKILPSQSILKINGKTTKTRTFNWEIPGPAQTGHSQTPALPKIILSNHVEFCQTCSAHAQGTNPFFRMGRKLKIFRWAQDFVHHFSPNWVQNIISEIIVWYYFNSSKTACCCWFEWQMTSMMLRGLQCWFPLRINNGQSRSEVENKTIYTSFTGGRVYPFGSLIFLLGLLLFFSSFSHQHFCLFWTNGGPEARPEKSVEYPRTKKLENWQAYLISKCSSHCDSKYSNEIQ